MSGGIDSALVAVIAKLALGSKRVDAVTLPSRFNKSETINDARKISANLNIPLHEIPIQPLFDSYLELLKPHFKGQPLDSTEENIQARIRGNLLMALSNKFGWLILTTGNKSETSTGYCTLYGDMAGGFAVLKDVLKTTVYALCRHINQTQKKELIPNSVLSRAPSAELRENQKDEDFLGTYEKLDEIIVQYVEKNRSFQEIAIKTKYDKGYLRKIIHLIDRNEYKRRQSPPGLKITPHAFGRDHRMPITNRFRSQK